MIVDQWKSREATGCKRRKQARLSQSAAASARRRQRRIKSWREVDTLLQEAKDNIRNNHGRKQTYEEREMIGLVLIREVERRVGDKVRSGEYIDVTTLQWTSIEKKVVRTLRSTVQSSRMAKLQKRTTSLSAELEVSSTIKASSLSSRTMMPWMWPTGLMKSI